MYHPKSGRPDAQRYLKLLSMPEVLSRTDDALSNYRPPIEAVRVDRANSRISAIDVRSRKDIPARTISAMDGYAVISSDLKDASSSAVVLKVMGNVTPEGHGFTRKLRSGEAVQVATGAPIPKGADAVVKMEETRLTATGMVAGRMIQRGKNISFRGEDVKAGQVVLRKGSIIGPADVALLIGSGVTRVKVYRIPQVGILSIGDELTRFDSKSANHISSGKKINNYFHLISGFLQEYGIHAPLLAIARDDPDDIARQVRRRLKDFDMIIAIAGSSVGAFDFTPDALLKVGNSRMVFHGVRVVPIRPAGLVMVRGKPVVITPGHAVSAALSFFTIAMRVLNRISGLPSDARQVFLRARASEAFSNDRPLDGFFLVTLKSHERQEEPSAIPLRWGSNLISSLSQANGFVRLSPEQRVEAGENLTVQLMSPLRTSTL